MSLRLLSEPGSKAFCQHLATFPGSTCLTVHICGRHSGRLLVVLHLPVVSLRFVAQQTDEHEESDRVGIKFDFSSEYKPMFAVKITGSGCSQQYTFKPHTV